MTNWFCPKNTASALLRSFRQTRSKDVGGIQQWQVGERPWISLFGVTYCKCLDSCKDNRNMVLRYESLPSTLATFAIVPLGKLIAAVLR
jgi:hypothetical protein